MVMFLVLHPMESISLNSFVLLEHLAMLLTSTLAINCLTQELVLKQGNRYHKLRKTFSKFYRRYYDLVSKFQVGLKSLLRQRLSEPESMVAWCINWRRLLALIISQRSSLKWFPIIKKIGYNINVLQQTACLVVNPITVDNFAFLFNCTSVCQTSDFMTAPT